MKRRKAHAIENSSFYRLGRKKDLAELLGLPIGEIVRLSSDENYKEWEKRAKGKKPRLIEEPLPRLDKLQRRVHELIKRVVTPDWLRSGKAGSKATENALAHAGGAYVVNVDIEAFFQSTKREYVYQCFVREFEIKKDIASILADVVTYKGHIPTGTATSQAMAFWAYKKSFERIHVLCAQNGIKMTLWVDDITFSRATSFPQRWTADIDKILRSVQLNLKMNKTKRYGVKEHKIITGTALTPTGLPRVRNAKRYEIVSILRGRVVEDLDLREARSLFGKLASQRQNEPDFFQHMFIRCKNHIRNLTRR